jgi:hypothetical protein
LRQPEQHHLRQRLRDAAEHGCNGESDNGDEEESLASEPRGQKPVTGVMIAAATI